MKSVNIKVCLPICRKLSHHDLPSLFRCLDCMVRIPRMRDFLLVTKKLCYENVINTFFPCVDHVSSVIYRNKRLI